MLSNRIYVHTKYDIVSDTVYVKLWASIHYNGGEKGNFKSTQYGVKYYPRPVLNT